MAKLKEAKIAENKDAKFVYDSKDPANAHFVGIFTDNGEPSRKKTSGDPSEYIAAVRETNGNLMYPSATDKITPHEIPIQGKAYYWFSVLTANEQKKMDAIRKEEEEKVKTEAEKAIIEEEKLKSVCEQLEMSEDTPAALKEFCEEVLNEEENTLTEEVKPEENPVIEVEKHKERSHKKREFKRP